MIRMAKSTSRQRSARSSPSRSPANAAVRKIAASCSLTATRASALHLLGVQDTEVARAPDRLALDAGRRVDRQTRSGAARGGRYAVHDHQVLVDRPRRALRRPSATR